MSERVIMISRPATPDEKEVIERKGGLRLNGDMRAGIVAKALSHAFDKREAELLKRSQQQAHLAMVESFGAAKLAMAKKLGEPWTVTCTDGYGHKYPNGVPTNFRVGYKTIALMVLDPLPSMIRNADSKYFKVQDKELITRIETLADDQQALTTEKGKTKATLEAMLQNLQAYSTLERTWPEGKKFYQHIPKDYPYRHQVPATLVADLNKSLGI